MKYQMLALALAVCLAGAPVNAELDTNQKALQIATNSISAFSKRFAELVFEEHSNTNVICSPFSAQVVLALSAFAAQGNTADQLFNALQISPSERNNATLGFQHLLEEFQSLQNLALNVATKVVIQNNLELNSEYVNKVKNKFHSEISPVSNVKSVVPDANKWVTEKTKGKITQILKEDDIDSDFGMLLLNAVYFQGNWQVPFNPKFTKLGTFTDLNGTEHKVPMMVNFINVFHGYSSDLNAIFAELPYKNPNYKMVIFVAEEGQTDAMRFEELGKKLKKYDYKNLASLGSSNEVIVALPKFTFESTIDLKPILEKMGATDMFNEKALFGNAIKTLNSNLYVSKIVQKTYIEVNEVGTEAAAATGNSKVNRIRSLDVLVNKPFYFSIVSPHGPIFEGRVLLPQLK